jgi:myo-inositol-1(or 4)-monophosphatase
LTCTEAPRSVATDHAGFGMAPIKKLNTLLQQVTPIAREAGRMTLAPQRDERATEEKSTAIDLVTAMDQRVEAYIRKQLTGMFPDHLFVGEEEDKDHPERIEDLPDDAWLVDPIDGTTNFAHGFSQYAVSIAYWHNQRPTVGIIYRPGSDELFTAITGVGAWLNGLPIACSKKSELAQSLTVTGYGYDRCEHPEKYIELTRRLMLNTHGVRRLGAACLDLCEVARGALDVYAEHQLKPWDFAAGMLIAQEAGTLVTHFDGSPLTFGKGGILACNPALHPQAVELLHDTPLD